MKSISVSDFRKRISEVLQSVEDNIEKVFIPGTKGRSGVVVMSLEEYNAIEETQYLMRTEANRAALKESMRQAENGEVITKSIEDLDELSVD